MVSDSFKLYGTDVQNKSDINTVPNWLQKVWHIYIQAYECIHTSNYRYLLCITDVTVRHRSPVFVLEVIGVVTQYCQLKIFVEQRLGQAAQKNRSKGELR